MLIAVEYYKDNEPQRNYARALYYLGKCYYYSGDTYDYNYNRKIIHGFEIVDQ